MSKAPRDYQQAAIASAVACLSREGSSLIVMATGTGKTYVASQIIYEAKSRGFRSLFLAHTDLLVRQAARELTATGLTCGVEMGKRRAAADDAILGQRTDVVVGSVQTFKGERLESWPKSSFGLVVIDEAHHAQAPSYQAIVRHFEESAWLLGLTATPERGDGKNLGSTFHSKAYEYPIAQGISDGWLSPIIWVVRPTAVSLKSLRRNKSDFTRGELEERISPHIEELCTVLVEEMESRPTVVFTPDVGSATAAADCLRQLGRTAEYVAGAGGNYGMDREEKDRKIAQFQKGETQVLTCCDLLIEGWDVPEVACVCLMRPTKLAGRMAQMVGRGTRCAPWANKTNCKVVDFNWQIDNASRIVCGPMTLFDDGTLTPEIKRRANFLVASMGMSDPRKAIAAAKDIVRQRRELRVTLTGSRSKESRFRHVVDPTSMAAILNIPTRPSSDFAENNPATAKQKAYLKTFGLEVDGLSRWGANRWIGHLNRRRSLGLATPPQVRLLVQLGVPAGEACEFTKEAASLAIEEKLGPKRSTPHPPSRQPTNQPPHPKTQSTLF